MTHAANLDLEKAYDKVDRHLLLKVVAKCLETETIAMMGALLLPVYIKMKNNPTDYVWPG